MFPQPLYVAIYVVGSSSVVFAFDWLNRDKPTVGLQFWRHLWHIPILWIITFSSSEIFIFILWQITILPWLCWPEFRYLWLTAAFALTHLGWITLMTHSSDVQKYQVKPTSDA